MNEGCREFVRAIDAAAAGDLPTDVMEHVAHCAACADRRAKNVRLARLMRGPSLTREASVEVARSALAKPDTSKTLVWATPLLSASATIAALILHFGLATATISNASELRELAEVEGADDTTTSIPSLEASETLSLPEPLQALNGLVFAENREVEP